VKPVDGLVDEMLLVDKSITGAFDGVPVLLVPLPVFELPVTMVVVVEVGDGELDDVL
jgi:hypothetical protein